MVLIHLVCKHCNKTFMKTKKRQTLCSKQCGKKNWRDSNKDKCKDYSKKYTLINREKINLQQKLRARHNYWNKGGRLKVIHRNMISRCNDSKDKSYKYYGAKGIKVCAEWLNFEVFEDWALKNGYSEDLTIERINPKKSYCKGNCKWITRLEQSYSRTNNNEFIGVYQTPSKKMGYRNLF